MAKKVLLVDNSRAVRLICRRVITALGFESLEAENGRAAMDRLKTNEPNLILLDLAMPEMDGFQAMREIRKRPEWAKLPIIALTAKAMKDDQQRCREAGANDYISKPLNVEMLLSLLRVWMPK